MSDSSRVLAATCSDLRGRLLQPNGAVIRLGDGTEYDRDTAKAIKDRMERDLEHYPEAKQKLGEVVAGADADVEVLRRVAAEVHSGARPDEGETSRVNGSWSLTRISGSTTRGPN